MGCSISRLELRGRGTEAGLRSIKHKMVEDVSRSDRAKLTDRSSETAKLLVKEIVARNSVALENKDIVLGGANELLNPQQERLKDPLYHAPEHDQEELGGGGGGGGGAIIPDFDGPLWMASPSFREYCVPVCDSDEDSVEGIAAITEGNLDAEKRSNKENVVQVTEIPNDDNHIQQDDSPGRSVKRRRNLRKVLTMRRPAAVRNLFSVTTCYNPLSPSPRNGPRKSPAKTL